MNSDNQRLLAGLVSTHQAVADYTIARLTESMRAAADNLTGEEDPREVLRSLADIFSELRPKETAQ